MEEVEECVSVCCCCGSLSLAALLRTSLRSRRLTTRSIRRRLIIIIPTKEALLQGPLRRLTLTADDRDTGATRARRSASVSRVVVSRFLLEALEAAALGGPLQEARGCGVSERERERGHTRLLARGDDIPRRACRYSPL